ncbi:T-cell surface glycoprotein CD3 gamma chain isoform 2-T3 [Acanthopagrus schlegelii]
MKCQSALSACLLLLCALTEFVSYAQADGTINVQFISDGIKLSCKGGKFEKKPDDQNKNDNYLELTYNDENTGEYECESSSKDRILSRIYVKFRTCDNCIELDGGTIAGLVTGNVVATIVIGVAVYLVVSQTRISPSTSHKKSSDRQHLVANEMPRGTNDHYQPLNTRTRQSDTYDMLHK